MPEMPEITAHAERMTESLAGSRLVGVQAINIAGLKTFDPPLDAAIGAAVREVSHRAKYLVIRFDDDVSHVIHLMQGGRLRPDPKRSRKPRNGIVRWVFERDGAEEAWLLTEAGTERRAGVWAVRGDPTDQPPLDGLGPDPLELSAEELGQIMKAESRRLHGVLRTQSIVSGLGRMLANELLFDAGLSPFANASKLSEQDVEALHRSIRRVVPAAIEHERTLDDIGKSVDRPSKVHNRAAEPCLGHPTDDGLEPCDDTVRTVEYRKYTVYYCPTRQTGGKVLADNTTSKFLK